MFDDSSINLRLRERMTHVVVEPKWRMTHGCCSNSNSFKNPLLDLNFLMKLACGFGMIVMCMGLQVVPVQLVLLGFSLFRGFTYCLCEDRHSKSESC